MKDSAKKKNKGGRPDLYKPEYCDLAIKILGERGTKSKLAKACGVDHDTLNIWAKKYPEFFGALREGSRIGRDAMLEMGLDHTFSRKPFRENTFKWLMSVMYGVRDKTEMKTENVTKVELKSEDINSLAKEVEAAALVRAKFSST